MMSDMSQPDDESTHHEAIEISRVDVRTDIHVV